MPARKAAQSPASRVVRVAIHPAIGVARVGNSERAEFVGPQVRDPAPVPPEELRDAAGALGRQVAEFRLYGFDADGKVVMEITAADAAITWTAHLANKKAAWYQWQIAMDTPEAAAVSTPRRNAGIVGAAERAALVIDGKRQSIGGQPQPARKFVGQFKGQAVTLGELRVGKKGRLLVLPGHGVSKAPRRDRIFTDGDPNSFGNADGWYDDIADGPVTATVEIDGRALVAEPAWVVTAPPNYAPQLKGVRTMYDLLVDLYIRAGWIAAPSSVSFRDDVHAILRRLTGLQWVNQGFAAQFGHFGPWNFEDPALIARLRQVPPAGTFDLHADLRRQIFNSFRPPEPRDGNPMPWPWLYGDASPDASGHDSPRQNCAITATQYETLRRWAQGDFVDDWLAPAAATSIDEVPLADQPTMLDRAALEFCLADAFHPGCEMTWPMRHLTLYASPFRVRHRAPGAQEVDPGPALTRDAALGVDGPLHAQGPGDLTRWMAIPWQADAAMCRSGYDHTYDPFLPSFWPARVPNQVLSQADYDTLVANDTTPEARMKAFSERQDWNSALGRGVAPAMKKMVQDFGSMGLLEKRDGPAGDPRFPAIVYVASLAPGFPAKPRERSARRLAAAVAPAAGPASPPAAPRGANFRSPGEAGSAPRPVRRPRD